MIVIAVILSPLAGSDVDRAPLDVSVAFSTALCGWVALQVGRRVSSGRYALACALLGVMNAGLTCLLAALGSGLTDGAVLLIPLLAALIGSPIALPLAGVYGALLSLPRRWMHDDAAPVHDAARTIEHTALWCAGIAFLVWLSPHVSTPLDWSAIPAQVACALGVLAVAVRLAQRRFLSRVARGRALPWYIAAEDEPLDEAKRPPALDPDAPEGGQLLYARETADGGPFRGHEQRTPLLVLGDPRRTIRFGLARAIFALLVGIALWTCPSPSEIEHRHRIPTHID